MGGRLDRGRTVRGIIVVALTVCTGWLTGWSALGPLGGLSMGIVTGAAAGVAVFGPEQSCSWRRRPRR